MAQDKAESVFATVDNHRMHVYLTGVMEKCGFRDTGEMNWCSHLYRGGERPVKVIRLDYALD